jgi:hypothetical protein
MFKKSMKMLAVSALALCALTAGASAQSVLMTKKVSVDFDFYAGKKLMPAGEYEFKLIPNHSHRLVQVRNTKTGAFSTIASVPNQNTRNAKPGEIKFNKYGDRYYLSRIQLGDSGVVHDVIKSKSERKLMRGLAVNTSDDQIVVGGAGQ